MTVFSYASIFIHATKIVVDAYPQTCKHTQRHTHRLCGKRSQMQQRSLQCANVKPKSSQSLRTLLCKKRASLWELRNAHRQANKQTHNIHTHTYIYVHTMYLCMYVCICYCFGAVVEQATLFLVTLSPTQSISPSPTHTHPQRALSFSLSACCCACV